MPGRLVTPLATLVVAVSTTVLASTEWAAAADQPSPRAGKPLTERIEDLRVRREVRDGYDRDLFDHWVDADGDGCDTRREVLIAEAVEDPAVGDGCAFDGGSWFSYYDGVTTEDSSTFDVDHVVALAEAWDSGARGWSAATRERFANDLGDRRSLVAVTASSNRSKSDQDPAEWLPERKQCRYLVSWVAVKTRWRLRVDRTELRALRDIAAGCDDVVVRVRLAR